MPAVKPIPDGYRTVTPYLIVSDGAGAIAFYAKAFGATERMRHHDARTAGSAMPS